MKTFGSILASATLLIAAAGVSAQSLHSTTAGVKRGEPFESTRMDVKPVQIQGVQVDEKLKTRLPLEATFRNEAGRTVRLADYFDGRKPVILQLGYMSCPMLCDLVSQGTANSLSALDLELGKDYDVIYLSIDPKEKEDLAAKKKQTYLANYAAARKLDDAGTKRAAEGWHLLTGDEDSIRQVADSVGFRYKWVATGSGPGEGQYSHPAVITLVTPDGVVSRYLYGVAFDKKLLRLSLAETSEGKVGSVMDQFILACFHFDPNSGNYTLAATRLMQLGGALTVLCLFSTLGLFQLRSRATRGLPARNRGLSAVLNNSTPQTTSPSDSSGTAAQQDSPSKTSKTDL